MPSEIRNKGSEAIGSEREIADSSRKNIFNKNIVLDDKNCSFYPDSEIRFSLIIKSSNITSLPPGLKIGRHCDLQHSDIRELPEDIEIGGSLYANEFLSTLPEKAVINTIHIPSENTDLITECESRGMKKMKKRENDDMEKSEEPLPFWVTFIRNPESI